MIAAISNNRKDSAMGLHALEAIRGVGVKSGGIGIGSPTIAAS